MRKEEEKIKVMNKSNASITVFLAMVCSIILSLLLVTIESARISGIRSCVSMALSQGGDAILARYYTPLFHDYYLFGRNVDQTTDGERKEILAKEWKDNMEYAQNPMVGLENKGDALLSMIPSKLIDLQVQDLTYLSDYESDGLFIQAAEAMEYVGLQLGVDAVLDSMNAFTDMSKATKAFAMQEEVEEELAELDEYTLELMSLLDGLTIKKGKLKFTEQNKLACRECFIKKYVILPVSMDSVKINHSIVYESIAPYYRDKRVLYSVCMDAVICLRVLYEQRNKLETEIATLELELQEDGQALEQISSNIVSIDESIESASQTLSSLMEEEEENQAAIDQIEQRIEVLYQSKEAYLEEYDAIYIRLEEEREQILEKSEELSQCNDDIEEKDHLVQEELTDIQYRMEALITLIEEAIETTKEACEVQKKAQQVVTDYEESLEELRDDLSKEIQSTLDEELQTMKESAGLVATSSHVYGNYEKILTTLEKNYDLLTNEFQIVDINTYLCYAEDMQGFLSRLQAQQKSFEDYSIQDLEFDYSTLNLQQEERNKVLDAVSGVVGNSLLNLVVEDTEMISDKEISFTGLPSTMNGVLHSSLPIEGTSYLSSVWKGSALDDLFNTFTKLFQGGTSAEEMVMDVVNDGLFHAYIQYFFKDYTVEEEKQAKTTKYPSVLDYEKEYLCFHKQTDRDNLIKMVETTCFVRLFLNFIKLYTSPECRVKAEALATTLVAFTGLAFLITITKILILLVWAVAESLVEVAALLKGKKVAIYEIGKCHIAFEELLGFSRALILSKAAQYKDHKGFGLDYDGYLLCYLLLQSKRNRCYGVMDLIQENINYRYEGEFHMNRCVTSMEAELTYEIPKSSLGGLLPDLSLTYKKNILMGY